MVVLLVLLLALGATAAAQEPAVLDRGTEAPERPRAERPFAWGGVVVPLVGYTGTDGFGAGLGGELFDRRRGLDSGFRNKIRASTYWAVSGQYSAHLFRYDRRGRHDLLLRLEFRNWSNMIYVGSGGADVVQFQPDEVALGNRVAEPSAVLAGLFRIPNTPLIVFAQGYARYASVAASGLLLERQPFGWLGGTYADTSVGVMLEELDRFPMPHKGIKAEASLRGGFTAADGRVEPIVGVNAEVIGWLPLVGQRLVLSGRFLFDKTWGDRPFFEQEWLGGLERDELAYEQMLTGYGRTRTRGDGVWANVIDLRVFLGRTRHPFWNVAFHMSAFAESAFVFDEGRLGPHLPTVGFGPVLLWQGAVRLRPWAGWGWVREVDGGPRVPQAQFGLALVEPL